MFLFCCSLVLTFRGAEGGMVDLMNGIVVMRSVLMPLGGTTDPLAGNVRGTCLKDKTCGSLCDQPQRLVELQGLWSPERPQTTRPVNIALPSRILE